MEQKSSYYKKRPITKFDFDKTNFFNAQNALKKHFLRTYPIVYTDDRTDLNQVRESAGYTDYVWLVDKSITVEKTFPWWFTPPALTDATVFQFPYVYKSAKKVKEWNMVQLVSTTATNHVFSKQRYICGEYDPYHSKAQFDMFYLQEKETLTRYNELTTRYPDLQSVTSIEEAIQNTTTDMFWLIPDDVVIDQAFCFDYVPDEWSYNYCHMFQNGNKKNYNGVVLMPNTYEPTSRELAYRHYASKKLVAQSASAPELYDVFYVDTYEDLVTAQATTETNMFWVVRSKLESTKVCLFDHRVAKWDEQYVHVFLNGQHYDGAALIPKNRAISKKEFENRCYLEQKVFNIVGNTPTPYAIYK